MRRQIKPKSAKTPKLTGDKNVDRFAKDVYDEINKLIDSVNTPHYKSEVHTRDGKPGDIRIVKNRSYGLSRKSTDSAYYIEGKTDDGWVRQYMQKVDHSGISREGTIPYNALTTDCKRQIKQGILSHWKADGKSNFSLNNKGSQSSDIYINENITVGKDVSKTLGIGDTKLARVTTGELSIDDNRIYRAGCADIPTTDTEAKVKTIEVAGTGIGKNAGTGDVTITITPDTIAGGISADTITTSQLNVHTDIVTLLDNTSMADVKSDLAIAHGDVSGFDTQVNTLAQAKVDSLIDSSPDALNTLNELAAALNDDASFSTTVTNSLSLKAPLASPTFTGTIAIPNIANLETKITTIETTAGAALPKAGGEMTGNITFSGSQTIDGRDLSVDGSKLDGVESGATADQTKSDIEGLGIQTVGTITSGTWQGTAIDKTRGGFGEDASSLSSSIAELNKLDGYTGDVNDLNILDGVTSTTSELNKLDGFTGDATDLNYAKSLYDTGVSSTEFDRLDGIGSAAVGVSDSVTLTNKTFNFDNNTMQGTLAVDRIPTLSAAKISDVDASGTYPTGDFDLANDTVYYQVYGKSGFHSFLKTARSDLIRHQTPSNIEYWNFSAGTPAWTSDPGAILTGLKNVLDGMSSTQWSMPLAYRKIRFEIERNNTWANHQAFVMETSWSQLTFSDGNFDGAGETAVPMNPSQILIEQWDGDNSNWTTNDNQTVDFGTSTIVDNWGTWMWYLSSGFHVNDTKLRFTIEFPAWDDSDANGSYDPPFYVRLKRLSMYSWYVGQENVNLPIRTNFDKDIIVGYDSTGVVTSEGNYDLQLKTGNSTTGNITIVDGANGDIQLNPNGSGKAEVDGNLSLKNAADDIVIDGATVLSKTVLGSGVTSSSLTTLGTISSGVWNGTAVANAYVADLPTSKITSGTFADARISSGSVTQHITKSYVDGLDITELGTVDSGVWNGTAVANAYVADLPTSKITSGTFADARIASSNVTQHQGDITGTGALNSGSITSGFGNINTGSGTITTTGSVGTGALTVTHGGWSGITVSNTASGTTGSHIELKNTATRYQLAVRSDTFDIREVDSDESLDASRFAIDNTGIIYIKGDTLKIGTAGTGLTLKNNSGALQLRNEADDADITLATTYTAAKCTDANADQTSANSAASITGITNSNIVQLTDSQTLTNKAIDSDNNTITNIVNADIKSGAAIATNKLSGAVTDIGSNGLGTAATKDTGTGTGNVILGNDSRLTDARECDNTFSSASTARGNLGGTTIGQNLFTLTNPGAISFLKVAADNTVTARSAANFRSDIGAGTSNFDGAYSSLSSIPSTFAPIVGTDSDEALAGNTTVTNWSGGSSGLTASTGRASLGGTTVGQNLFTMSNPGAVRFIKIAADNTVSTRAAADFRSDIGAGTSNIAIGSGSGDALAGDTVATDIGGISASSTNTLTNKTFDANGTGNSISNVDMANDVTGTLPAGNGGTGLTDISTLLNSNTTKGDVGLGNVTNESKATMFENPTFTTSSGSLNINAASSTDTVVVTGASMTASQTGGSQLIHVEQTFNAPLVGSQNGHSLLKVNANTTGNGVQDFDNMYTISASENDTINFGVKHDGSIDKGSITSGFGTINNGSSDITTTGTISFGSLTDSGESITVTKFVDESDGIGSNDNDTTIPTSAAVKDYVDSNAVESIHWTRSTGGYFTANDTAKRTQSWEGDETWGNTVSITTSLGGAMSLNYSDVYGGIWIAPVASKVTKSSIVVRALSYADDITIRLYKVNPATLALTQIYTEDITIPNTSSVVAVNDTLSVSNSIEENYVLLATMEKQSTSGSSRIYFTWTISGTYD